jgi:hypothetical protein
MIQNRQREMWLSLSIRLDQQIAAPDSITWDATRDPMLQFPPCREDQILVPSTHIRHVGLTHRHLSLLPPSPIKMMRNRPTARLRHERFEANNVLLHPLRFGMGEDLAAGP